MKRTCLVVLLPIFCWAFGTIAPAQSLLVKKADRDFENRNYQNAIGRYLRAYNSLEQTEKWYPAARIGDCYRVLRKQQQAARWYAKAFEYPECAPSYFLEYAHAMLKKGDSEAAAEGFSAWLKRNPNDERIKAWRDFAKAIPEQAPDTAGYSIDFMTFNSGRSDYGPAFFEDGLIFCSERNNSTVGLTYREKGTGEQLLDLYYVEAKDSISWKKPIPLPRNINSRLHEGPVAIMPGISGMFFTRSRKLPARIGSQAPPIAGIWFTRKEDNRWTDPELLPIDQAKTTAAHPTLNKQGDVMIFASDAPGGFGGMDLYVTRHNGSDWSEPQNLGPEVNTPGQEVFPFLHQDGTLYFSSNGHPGFGGLDIFKAIPTGSGWGRTSNPGLPLNSPMNDFSYIVSEDKTEGYFASNRAGSGQYDNIYKVYLTEKAPEFRDCPVQQDANKCFTFFEEETGDSLPYSLVYRWDLGDGSSATGPTTYHCFDTAGTYTIRLDVVDSLTGEAVFNQATYSLQVLDPKQAFIDADAIGVVDETMTMNGLKYDLPGFKPERFYWDFGDGNLSRGPEVDHKFRAAGIYDVRLGLAGSDPETGAEVLHCVTRPIEIQSGEPVVAEVDDSLPPPDTLVTNVAPTRLGEGINYRLQLGTSLFQVKTNPANFKGLENVDEIQAKGYYRYLYGVHDNLESAFEQQQELQNKGFSHPVILAFKDGELLQDQPFLENWLPGDDLPEVTVRGTILDRNNVPQKGVIVWENLMNGDVIQETNVTDPSGQYVENLPKDIYYGYYVDLDGYYSISKTLDLTNYKGDVVIEEEIELYSVEDMIREKIPVRINNVFFDIGSYELKKTSYAELYRLLRFLLEQGSLKVEISGHTDATGTETDNFGLSRKRAAEVKKFLVLGGIAPENIIIVGYGETQPIASNLTEEDRMFNRRVEFRLLGRN